MLTHSQVVLVDNKYAAIGGLDLCVGRWDTHTHPLADVHSTNLFKTLFPGQDYNNNRILDFHQVSNYVSNALSIRDYGRMPWHDVGSFMFRCLASLTMIAQVHMTLTGNVTLDIAQHFIERWNKIKQRKACKTCLFYCLFFNIVSSLSTAKISECGVYALVDYRLTSCKVLMLSLHFLTSLSMLPMKP